MRQALLKRGLPRKSYLDDGPAFRFHHLKEITVSLGIALVHSSSRAGARSKDFSAPSDPNFSPASSAIPFETSMRPWSAELGTSTTSASIGASDRTPCNA
ncbi:hypothetical protein DFAR_2210044 [Desulfarculales bacterium]